MVRADSMWRWATNRRGRPYAVAHHDVATVYIFDGAGDADEWQGRWAVACETCSDDNRLEWRFESIAEAIDFAPSALVAMCGLHHTAEAVATLHDGRADA